MRNGEGRKEEVRNGERNEEGVTDGDGRESLRGFHHEERLMGINARLSLFFRVLNAQVNAHANLLL